MKKIAILGSTGSIGTQTLEVVRAQGDLQVTAMAAGHNIDLFEQQIREFLPRNVAVWEEKDAHDLRTRVADLGVKVHFGMEGLIEIAADPDSVYDGFFFYSSHKNITCYVSFLSSFLLIRRSCLLICGYK